MLKKSIILFTLLFLILNHTAFSQDIKFGKVSKQELEEKAYPSDPSANAAILYKKRRTHFDYSSQSGWTLITKVHERIKIYNKQGNDWATKQISLYQDGDSETVSIKANTFNLKNGSIEKIKLKKNEIFTEDYDKFWSRKKFTMPNLTEGSVVEWEYTIRSPYFFNINDMVFQYKIPLKYIDTEIKIPEYFVFKYRPSTFYPINISQTQKTRKINFTYRSKDDSRVGGSIKTSTQNASVDINEKIYTSIETQIPAIKDEPYINNLNNYISKTSFELTAYTPKNDTHTYYNTTWEDVCETIYKNSNFGEQLKKKSHFKDDLQNLIVNSTSDTEKIVTIFEYVKNKIKWNNYRGKYTDIGVKKAYKLGVGNAAEINLTLVSMLRESGINANPILVSTRDHGIPLFPTTQGFNYVIAGVEKGSDLIVLDATEKYSLPNVLPLRALNWQGRIIRQDESSAAVNLFSEKASSKKVFLSAKIDEEGVLNGLSRIMYENLLALNYRKNYNDVVNEDLIGILEKNNQNIEIKNLKVSNDKDLSKPLIHTISFETDGQTEIIGDKIYFSPLLFLTKKENPFKLNERKYPIAFGSPLEEKYTINIQIPVGYKIDVKPENVVYTLPENLGRYKFICIQKDNKLQLLSNIKINQSILASTYYSALKEFYKKMIEKQSEKIVLSKI